MGHTSAKDDGNYTRSADANEQDLEDERMASADSKTGVEYAVGTSGDKKAYGHKGEKTSKRCVLTCFFPDGSPLQGSDYSLSCCFVSLQ
jgi:hypothetical protein